MTRVDVGCLATAIGLAVLLSGAGSTPEAPPEPVEAQRSTIAEAPERLPSAALLSVYFYANFTSAEWLPAELRPIDLSAAVEILSSGAPGVEPERRLAITWLAARGAPEHRRALELLRAPIAEIGVLSLPEPPPRPEIQSVEQAAALLPELILALKPRLAAIHALLNQLSGPAIPGCPDGDFKIPVDIQKDLATGATTATVYAWVKRDFSIVCSALDPQRWDACSDYFAETHAAQKAGSGYPIEADCSVKEALSSPALCTSPLSYELYERFEIPLTLSGTTVVMAWYKQLLTIESKSLSSTPNGHVYHYKLYQPRQMCSRVGLDERPGGLSINQGHVTIEQRASEPAWTDLELTKTVLFSDRELLMDLSLNFWAPLTLQGMGYQLYRMACCPP